MNIIEKTIVSLKNRDDLENALYVSNQIGDFVTHKDKVKHVIEFYTEFVKSEISDEMILTIKENLIGISEQFSGRIRASAIEALSKFCFDDIEFLREALKKDLIALLEANAALSASIIALSNANEEILSEDGHSIIEVENSIRDASNYLMKYFKDTSFPW